MSETYCQVGVFVSDKTKEVLRAYMENGASALSDQLSENLIDYLGTLPTAESVADNVIGLVADYSNLDDEDLIKVFESIAYFEPDQIIFYYSDDEETQFYGWFDGKKARRLYTIGKSSDIDAHLNQKQFDESCIAFIREKYQAKIRKPKKPALASLAGEMDSVEESTGDSDSAWKVNDKKWMKERRAKWPRVKQLLSDTLFLGNAARYTRSEFTKLMQNYFLTGTLDDNYTFEHQDGALFLKLWMHPDKSEQYWRQYVEELGPEKVKSQSYFVKRMLGRSSDGIYEPLDGREPLIYELFTEARLLRHNYPDKSDDEWRIYAQQNFSSISRSIDCMFAWPTRNPRHYQMLEFRKWLDSFVQGYVLCLGFAFLVRHVGHVLGNKNKYDVFLVDYAQKFESAFSSEQAPREARDNIAEIRAMSDKEFNKYQNKLDWYPVGMR